MGYPKSQRQSLTIWEFELFHHYITRVTQSFLAPPVMQELLSGEAITQATRHDFLFDITLMASCLHLALTKSPLFTPAHRDFILGGCSGVMEKFRKEAENIDESNWRVVKPFAFLMAVYTLSLPLLDNAPESPDTVLDDIIRVLSLLRGIRIFASLTDGLDTESENSRAENEAFRIPYAANSQDELDLNRIVADLVDQTSVDRAGGVQI
ncbi:C6 transcription factor [Fusarium mexicanum]|uniref:C6 transcription factor n=1 Tax=Fusarium mexicanum TaxID=751941 RepID=A0A8H5I7Y8_9HYPO|nr:C6 transcription factor [Fusarium mexicanum]